MNVSSYSIRQPLPAILFFILLSLVGVLGFKSMKNQQFPDIDLPMITVNATLAGAAPAQMETEVARKLENSIATINGIKHVYTKIGQGLAIVTVEFRLEKPTQEALDDVRDAISRVRADLPAALDEPVVTRVNLAGTPMLTYTIAATDGARDEESLSWFVDHAVTKALLSVRGVGAVSRVGGVSRQISVDLDPTRMISFGVAAGDISRAVRAMQLDAPGGRADIGGIEQSLRALGTVSSVQDLAALEIPLADGRRVRLDQIARVTDTVAERSGGAVLDGAPVVGFEIVRSRGAGEVQVMHAVRAELDKLKVDNPGIVITEAFNFVDPVVENFEGSMWLLLEGALLAVIVVWLFLRDWRATFVSATALPLSIIPTFGAMWLMGFSLNVVTMLSISLVVGILVDDAIVEIENIMRHLRMGKSPRDAAMEAADEIGLAVIATTFTLIAVFLPTAFMDGVSGKFFVQFGWTAAIAVFTSLLVARMLTPMMAAYLLRAPRADEAAEPGWMPRYLAWVAGCINHRGRTLIATAIFFVGSFALVPYIGAGFMPPDDLSQTQIYLSLAPGSTYAQTNDMAEQARQIAAKNPHVRLIYTAVGGGRSGADPFAPSAGDEVRKATLTLKLSAREERAGVTKQDVERDLREALAVLPGVQVKVGFGGSAEKYVLVLASEDGALLSQVAPQVERELRTHPAMAGVGSIWTTASLVRPELIARIDTARAAAQGVSTEAIADALRIATAGDYDQNLPKLNLAQRQIPIVIKLPREARQDLALLAQLPVMGTRGPMPLHNVVELSLGSGPSEIDRYDRQRNINFEIELNGVPLGEVQERLTQLPSLQKLPAGVSQAVVGDAEAMAELTSSFALAMGTGVLCIYMVLVLLFRDFVQPMTILAALVLSIPGAFLALFLTGTATSMPSMIGMIMLMGIATKNSILLVDYVIIARREHAQDTVNGKHFSRYDALIDACRKRARPIIMTTVAMGAGMMPIALGWGNDPSFRAPMAIVVIGGLITSTFLSLLVIPVVFTYVDDAIEFVRRRAGRQGA
jgi:multidrug efflux pump subunit AcrB